MTEHVPPDRVQLGALRLPAIPLELNDTLPPGVMTVPGDVSVTVAVHVEACPIGTDGGLHETPVEVLRCVTVTVVEVGPLPEWAESPPYVAEMLCDPVPMTVCV